MTFRIPDEFRKPEYSGLFSYNIEQDKWKEYLIDIEDARTDMLDCGRILARMNHAMVFNTVLYP